MICYKDKKGHLIWTINPAIRLAAAFIAVLVVPFSFGFFDGFSGKTLSPAALCVGAAVFLLCLSACIYRDCFIFDDTEKKLVHKNGFACFYKKKEIPFADIGCVRLFLLQRAGVPFALRCSLCSRDASILCDMDFVKKSKQHALERKAQKTAQYLHCPLERETV